MSNKKSFVMYVDSLDILKKLTDEQAGQLIKAIAAYHSGDDFELDPLLDIVITPFIGQFKRDAEKYKKTCEKRALAGAMGGKQKQANLANASKSKQDVANLADNENDTVTDTDTDTDTDIKDTSVSAKPKPSNYKFNDDQMKFAEAVYGKVKEVTPQMKQPNLESWANTARLMAESDKFILRDVWDVFCWANSDNFWRTNILSVSKLREKYPELKAKSQGAPAKQEAPRPSRQEFKI